LLVGRGDEVSVGHGLGLDFGSIGNDGDAVIALIGVVGLVTTIFCS
jgi:hypothetical protein